MNDKEILNEIVEAIETYGAAYSDSQILDVIIEILNREGK